LPTYSVTGNTFIVDDTGGNTLAAGNASSTMRRGAATTSAMMASTLQAQANTVADLIEQIQTSGLYPPGGAPMAAEVFIPTVSITLCRPTACGWKLI
jgi:hypothetical protein